MPLEPGHACQAKSIRAAGRARGFHRLRILLAEFGGVTGYAVEIAG